MTFGNKCWYAFVIGSLVFQAGSTGYLIADIEATKDDVIVGVVMTITATALLVYNWWRSYPKPRTVKFTFHETPILKTSKTEILDAEFEDVK